MLQIIPCLGRLRRHKELLISLKHALGAYLCRSNWEKRLVILYDYVVYLQKHEFDIGLEDDLLYFNQAKQIVNAQKWTDAMKAIKDNDI